MTGHETLQDQGPSAVGRFKSSPAVVAIGTSDGGLQALQTMLARIPPNGAVAWVVAGCPEPGEGARLTEHLRPHVSVPVEEVTDPVTLEADRVYVLPTGGDVDVFDSQLRVSVVDPADRGRTPIDRLLCTLAQAQGGDTVAVVLSGAGSDGAAGLKAIRAAGGLAVVQEPQEAEHDALPRSALSTGLVDLVLPVERIVAEILSFVRTRPRVDVPDRTEEAAAEEGQGRRVEKLLAQVWARTGRDLRPYRRSTVLRHIARRMRLRHVEELVDYLELVRHDPDESEALADGLLLTVTHFFRDPEQYEALAREVVPGLLAEKEAQDEVRAWSVGCRTGEEAYSLAMLLLEEAERQPRPARIQVIASDLHARSIAWARDGFYAADVEADVSPERLHRFFRPEPGGYRIRAEVRECVVFAHHDLLTDPPYARLDLIACRDLLPYLEPDPRQEAMALFHWALRPRGVLVLNRSEAPEPGELFRPLGAPNGVYRRLDAVVPPPRRLASELTLPGIGQPSRHDPSPSHGPLHQRMLERYAPPSLLVGPDDAVTHVSEHAGRFLLHRGGPVSARVDRLVRPELCLELRAELEEVRRSGEPRSSAPIPVALDEGIRPVVLHVRPAAQADAENEGSVLVLFEQRASSELMQAGLVGSDETGADGAAPPGAERVNRLETELERARERLLTLTETHETTEEELRAANEELQSSNEELRSALEELETTNEELESTNHELQVLAKENRGKANELRRLSTDLERLLLSTDIGTLFLDRELRIVRYTPRIAALFHARPSDRGRPLRDLHHRLEYDELLDDAGAVLTGSQPIEREVQDEDGRWYLARVLPHRGTGGRLEGVVVVFVDTTTRKRLAEAEEANRAKSQFLATMSHELRTPLTAVIGLSDLMETEVLGSMNEKQRRNLGRIKAAAWHLVRIIDEVLSFSRSEAGKERLNVGDADLARVVRDVVDLIQPTAERERVEAWLDLPEPSIPMRTDAGKLAQIVTNLVGNAVKFARSEVIVTVEAGDAWVDLRVRDDGPGMPSDRLEEIFEPFRQLDGSTTRKKGGTGLGLTIARRQARLLGGDVLVESRPDAGSTFTLRLPRVGGGTEQEAG